MLTVILSFFVSIWGVQDFQRALTFEIDPKGCRQGELIHKHKVDNGSCYRFRLDQAKVMQTAEFDFDDGWVWVPFSGRLPIAYCCDQEEDKSIISVYCDRAETIKCANF